jgi:NAD-dependent epimerase/dehydratase family protein
MWGGSLTIVREGKVMECPPTSLRTIVRKRVLVTGGAGSLGSHLCEGLLAQGHDVLCVDNYFTGRRTTLPSCPIPNSRRCGTISASPSMSKSTKSTISLASFAPLSLA